jgi:hypothetical protein
VLDEIREVGIGILARDVVTYSTAATLAAEPRPAGGFSTSPAFTNGDHLKAVEAEYLSRVLAVLLWPGARRPDFTTCIDRVRSEAASLWPTTPRRCRPRVVDTEFTVMCSPDRTTHLEVPNCQT